VGSFSRNEEDPELLLRNDHLRLVLKTRRISNETPTPRLVWGLSEIIPVWIRHHSNLTLFRLQTHSLSDPQCSRAKTVFKTPTWHHEEVTRRARNNENFVSYLFFFLPQRRLNCRIDLGLMLSVFLKLPTFSLSFSLSSLYTSTVSSTVLYVEAKILITVCPILYCLKP